MISTPPFCSAMPPPPPSSTAKNHFDRATARLLRPELSAKGEDGSSLSVPFRHGGFIQMKGGKVFTEAVRRMVTSLNRVCQREHLSVQDLDLVVPHQANQRIIDAIQHRIGINVFSNIRHHGNTSSSSIPLCLADVLPTVRPATGSASVPSAAASRSEPGSSKRINTPLPDERLGNDAARMTKSE